MIAQGGERSTYENRVVGQAVGDLSRGKHRPPAASGQFEPAQGVHGRSQAAVGTHPAAVRAESRVVRQACGSAAGWAERGVGASRKVRCDLVRWSSSRLTSAAASRSAALSRTSPSGTPRSRRSPLVAHGQAGETVRGGVGSPRRHPNAQSVLQRATPGSGEPVLERVRVGCQPTGADYGPLEPRSVVETTPSHSRRWPARRLQWPQ